MISFKEYSSLFESLFFKKDKLVYARQNTRYSSSSDSISTFHNKMATGYVSDEAKNFNNVKVISLYNYLSSEESKKILKTLKDNTGEAALSDTLYHTFLEDTAIYAADLIKKQKQKIDVIIYPESTSTFLKDFINKLKGKVSGITFLDEVIVKKRIHDVEKYAEQMIDKDYYGYDKFKQQDIDQIILSIIRNVQANEQAGKGPILTLKGTTAKRNNHLIKNFLEIVDDSILQIENKNVLIIDDSWSTGASLREMMRVVQDFTPASLVTLTIFKLTSMNKKPKTDK